MKRDILKNSIKMIGISLIIYATILFFLFLYKGDTFEVWVSGNDGLKIEEFLSEEDGVKIHYLFLSNSFTEDIINISYMGKVRKISQGDLKDGYIALGKRLEDTKITVYLENESVEYIIIKISNLPAMVIDGNENLLDKLQDDKENKMKDLAMHLFSDSERDTYPIEIKGRGNSSWVWYDKKSYTIGLDQSTSLLGMERAEEWILLSNSGDGSLLKNKIALDLSKDLKMDATIDSEFIDLWIAGEYLGTYLLCQKPSMEKIYDDNVKDGLLIELDNAFYKDSKYWIESEVTGNHYVIKDYGTSEIIDDKIVDFKVFIEEIEQCLYSNSCDEQKIIDMIDLDSLSAYYTINEYMLNHESLGITSINMYWRGEGDKLHFGPVWDFDTCMSSSGFEPEDSFSVFWTEKFLQKIIFLPKVSEFISEKWDNDYEKYFHRLLGQIDAYYSIVEKSADCNYTRWDLLGKEHFKGALENTYLLEIDKLKDWVEKRNNFFCPINCVYKYEFTGHGSIKITVEPKKNFNDITMWTHWDDNSNSISAVSLKEIRDNVWEVELNIPYNSNGILRMEFEGESEGICKRIYVGSINFQQQVTFENTKDYLNIKYKTNNTSLNSVYIWVIPMDDIEKTSCIKAESEDGVWTVKIADKFINYDSRYKIVITLKDGVSETNLMEKELILKDIN